jgi:single-strand DNA-binding protein
MLNHITIMGRLTSNPELRRTGSGVAVTSFTLAVDRDFKTNGETETDFFDCVAWRQTGEFVNQFFAKGRMAVVSGRLQNRSWTDKDGNKRKVSEVVVDNIYFGDSKKEDKTEEADVAEANFSLLPDDGELPF